ncbi:AMIN-like domain-containing (lipo)protein [Saccharopolyspora sp. 5N708]|uniref:AMIN-like domain-containing (lipo)protein n=1 Tax=Saccharopolyspora sp. 5N708 TaxID=3457424 RepID=UPI003FD42FC5
MSLRSKLVLATGSIVLSVLALTGCAAGADTPAAPAGGSAALGVASNLTAAAKPDIRAGVHGGEERVVFDFSSLPNVDGLRVMSHELNEVAPVWGPSAEPVEGMTGKSFIHIRLEIADPARTTAGPVQFGQSLARSAVVNDNSHGTGELTIGVSEGVDYEVLVEGDKVIINMAQGPLGR